MPFSDSSPMSGSFSKGDMMKNTHDDYARSALGYDDEKEIVVSDGKVISHDDKDWHEFCGALRQIKENEG
jgi:hypothetical protein